MQNREEKIAEIKTLADALVVIASMKSELEVATEALRFYARMQFHRREEKIRGVIDEDGGERASRALDDLGEPVSFFDEDLISNKE